MRQIFWVLTAGVLSVALGVFVLLRLGELTGSNPVSAGGWITVSLAAVTFADIAGMVLLFGRRTERMGSAVLAVSAPLTLWLSFFAPTVSYYVFGTTLTGLLTGSGALGLVVLAIVGLALVWLFARGARRGLRVRTSVA